MISESLLAVQPLQEEDEDKEEEDDIVDEEGDFGKVRIKHSDFLCLCKKMIF